MKSYSDCTREKSPKSHQPIPHMLLESKYSVTECETLAICADMDAAAKTGQSKHTT